ncbi:hypothetical protein EVAR_18874_1 [Eumeta japonica]|uniref:Uncharacterized protein n=1 Tax=Eumeta variegata TaxID=151549 RepID=A0A4C1UMS5_EUMVA|nr:hypothetical protein EVAR_18874_1 [Eumeta japonica]
MKFQRKNIDLDSIIQTQEDDAENPSSSTEITLSQDGASQPSQAKKSRKVAKEKPAKLNLCWKKKNLELNTEQLMFTGNKILGPDLLELDTPVQFFFFTYFHKI